MKKTSILAALALIMVACTKAPEEPQMRSVTFTFGNILNGSMTKGSDDVLEASAPAGPFILRLTSTTNPNRTYRVNAGEPATIAMDSYRVLCDYYPAGAIEVYRGKLYTEPCFTVNTTITTLVTLVVLYIMGVSSIKEFVFPLIVGMLAGVYSSVFLSGQFWASWMDKGTFDGLKNLQDEEVKHEYTYASSREAFHAAVSAIQKILKDQGFESKKTGEWTKMDKVRIGIIGVGNMGSGHLKNIVADKVPDMVLTAVCDLKPERLEWAKENAPGVATFDDATKMMESGLIDAVIVATPHYDHPRLVREALEHGLHAMSEKPAGVYTKNVHELIEFAKTQDKIYAIMFNQRTNCVYRKMKEIVSSGEMGAIRRTNWIITNWFRSQSYYDSGAWRATWEGEGGGVLLNQCPHNLDLWQWICGMPNKVRAFCHNGKWHDIEVEDDVTAYVEYPNGATGVFVTTTSDAPGTNRFEIDLDKVQLVCDGKKLIKRELSMSIPEFHKTYKGGFGSPEVTETEVETDGENLQHVGVLRAFTNKILGRGELIADGAEGVNGLTISNAMHLSSWLDKTIELPLDEDLFLEELNKRRATSRLKKNVEEVTFDTSSSYAGTKK